jgi:hypothetical protein
VTRYQWVAAVLACGGLAVGVTLGAAFAAIPDRGWARNWPWYVLLLAGPYLLCAVACWRSVLGRWVRISSAATCTAGFLVAALVVCELSPVIVGAKSPHDVLASVFVGGHIIVFIQYPLALLALAHAFTDPRAPVPTPSA